jgi:hypothetical protein
MPTKKTKPAAVAQASVTNADTRYVLVQDNDSHWYVIPEGKQAEFNAWLEIDSDDERAWDAPEFAHAVGGAPSAVSFKDPHIFGKPVQDSV